ncbi:M1 family aminopeptidase [Flavobacterium chuncheonense]|uniref:Aminopeptidase N n=1 Tax=Flavobacterium chuncheonense TaxID=2026653 RepID=A0ABW5YMT2_9FLAO
MKKITLLFLLTVSLFGYTQNDESHFEKMVEAEMKSAASIQNFQVNPNTQNYDITYHELRFTVDPAVHYITGQVATTFTALSNMNTVVFDLANQLTVNSVSMNGNALSFSQNTTDELTINLPSTLTTGSVATVVINYQGAPPTSENAFTISTHSGVPVLWTLSEPFGARDWWPCKQDLNDKVNSIDVYIKAPITYTSVSNGLEQSAIDNGDGTKTTHFHHNYPIPAYLIAIAVTNYTIFNQQGGLGTAPSPYFPIVNYIYPETATSTQNSLSVTPGIINFFESILGPYPFRNEKYGHAQFGWGGGMEHTTVSFMGSWSRGLIAHEMAHQWFGNKVTCGTWKDIWLNEGITEYMSGMVVENFDGATGFVNWKIGKTNSITSLPGGNLYLTNTQALDVNRIFSSRLTYNKGSMVTNMIRYVMGDTAFLQALQNYLNDVNLSYNYAITTDFKSHIETSSNLDFTEFFNDWVYNEGYPTYNITAQNWGNGQAKITVNQTQSHPSVTYFEMPLLIRLNDGNGNTHDVTVNNTVNGEEFIVPVPFTVAGIEFDPNKDIISKNNTATLSNEDFNFDDTVVLYPNPSSANVHMMLPDNITLEEIVFFNNLGQKVSSFNEKDFSVENLPIGVYTVTIKTTEGLIHKNFIKK